MDERTSGKNNRLVAIELQPKDLQIRDAHKYLPHNRSTNSDDVTGSCDDVTNSGSGEFRSSSVSEPTKRLKNSLNKKDYLSENDISVIEHPKIHSLRSQISSQLSNSLNALPDPDDKFSQLVNRTQIKVHSCWGRYKHIVKLIFKLILLTLYLVYLGFAIHHNVYRSLFLVIMTSLYFIYFIYGKCIKPYLKCVVPCFTAEWWIRNQKLKTVIKW